MIILCDLLVIRKYYQCARPTGARGVGGTVGGGWSANQATDASTLDGRWHSWWRVQGSAHRVVCTPNEVKLNVFVLV